MKKAKKTYEKTIYYLINTLFAVILIVGILQVFFRYVVGSSLIWSEELSRYLCIWLVFLGAVAGIPRGVHLAVDLISARRGGRPKAIMKIISSLFVIAFLLVLFFEGIQIVLRTMNQASTAMGIPLGLVYMAIPLCSGFMIYEFLKLAINNIILLRRR